MDATVSKHEPAGRWEYRGFCPSCQSQTTFQAFNKWFRDYLICPSCPGGSAPRERALALVLSEIRPNWRELSLHESSPSPTGVSVVMAREGKNYTVSQYFPDHPFGSTIGGVRNENLEQQTFEDEAFDVVVSLDVMEHVYHPDKVFSEIYRTLKPGGVYISTFPVRNHQVTGWERRLVQNEDGTINHIKEPEIHGNPVNEEGSIVTIDYGYDLHKTIAGWAPFDVRVSRFHDSHHGIMGEYTEVVICTKQAWNFHPTPAELAERAATEIDFLQRRLETMKQQRFDLERQLTELKESTSWKITAPIRCARTYLRRKAV